MSWHYLQEQEEASWEASCLVGAPSALSKLIPTHAESYSPASVTDTSADSRSGTTLPHSKGDHGKVTSMSSLEDSRAKTLASPEKAQELPEREVDSGKSLPASFAKWDRGTSSWKTHQLSLLEGLEPCSETWPRWGTMRAGESYLRPTPSGLLAIRALITSERESGFVERLPTLLVQDGNGCDRHNQKDGSVTLSLLGRVRRMPSPKARDWRTGDLQQNRRARMKQTGVWRSPDLNEIAAPGGQLNPTWTEWFQGFPIGWTALGALGTPKFRQWLDSHGKL